MRPLGRGAAANIFGTRVKDCAHGVEKWKVRHRVVVFMATSGAYEGATIR